MTRRENELLAALKTCLEHLEREAAATRQMIIRIRGVVFQTEIAIAAERVRKADRDGDAAYAWNLEEVLH